MRVQMNACLIGLCKIIFWRAINKFSISVKTSRIVHARAELKNKGSILDPLGGYGT